MLNSGQALLFVPPNNSSAAPTDSTAVCDMVSDTRTESMPVADLAFPASPVSPPASPHISHTDKETIDLDKIDLEKSNEKTPIQGTGSRRRRASVVSFGLPGMVEDDPALAGTVHESFDSDAPDDANDGLSFWQRFVRNWKRSLEPPKAQYLNDAGPDDFPDGGVRILL